MAALAAPFDTHVSAGVDDDDHDTRQLGLHVLAWLCTGVAACTVAMKVFTKARIIKVVGWDDFIILLSLALSIIAASLVSSAVTHGFGRHTAAVLAEPDGTQRLAIVMLKLRVGFGAALQIGAFNFPNIAVALLVVQLLDPNVGRACALFGLVAMQAVAAIAAMAVVLCDSDGFAGMAYFVAAYAALMDVVLAAVPVATFCRLQMPARTRFALCFLMGLTLLSAAVTVVKASYLYHFTEDADPLWNIVPLISWGLVEQTVVIVVACLPTLRPLFTQGALPPVQYHDDAPSPRGSSSWLGSWKTAYAIKPTKGGHQQLCSAWGIGEERKPRRPRATSPSDVMPLHNVHRRQSGRPSYYPSDPMDDPVFPDEAGSQKGIVRTVTVAMDWGVRRPLSADSVKTDWILPLPPAIKEKRLSTCVEGTCPGEEERRDVH